MTARFKAAFALLACVALVACGRLPFGYTTVGEIVAAPGTFEGKEIRLRGTVTDITHIPIVEWKSYRLKDETGEILVITPGELPAVNDRVKVTGNVRSAAIIAGQSLGLRIQEKQRL